MNKSLVIFHFQPLEGYPPIQNLINILDDTSKLKSCCVSTRGNFSFQFQSKRTKLYRLFGSQKSILRYFSYLYYNLFGFVLLLVKRPKRVLYFETLSSFPVLCYKFFRPSVQVFVHYHEYDSLMDYKKSSVINRFYHRFEVKMYSKLKWISHTNSDRLNKFIDDYALEPSKALNVVPNYPSKSWCLKKENNKSSKEDKVKFVYVGYSLDFNTMYVKELIDYVAKNESNFTLDFYLFKPALDVLEYTKSVTNINFHEGVDYFTLPEVLFKYDVGLIIYKGVTDNYNFNAPNKLFEYLACGLTVWVPKVMDGVKPYLSTSVCAIDFEDLDGGDFNFYKIREFSQSKNNEYFAEDALLTLILELSK